MRLGITAGHSGFERCCTIVHRPPRSRRRERWGKSIFFPRWRESRGHLRRMRYFE